MTEHHTWSDRQKVVTTPLFPGYAFVHIDESRDAREAVLRTAGLIGFVSFGGNAAAVTANQIEDLQLLLRVTCLSSLYPFVHAAQRVRIRATSLGGLEATMMRA